MKKTAPLAILTVCLLLAAWFLLKPEAKNQNTNLDEVSEDLDRHFTGRKIQPTPQKESSKALRPKNISQAKAKETNDMGNEKSVETPTILPNDPTPKTADFDASLVEDLKDLPEAAQFSKEQMKVLRGLARDIDKTLKDLDVESENEDIGNGDHLTEEELNEARSDIMDSETPEEDIEPEE